MTKQKTNETQPDIVWAPLPGSQTAFLTCPIRECLYHGTRGPGKTDCLIMSFCQHVGKGYGQYWRGVIFREQFKNLKDVVAKTKRWIPQIWPQAKFNESKHTWHFPDGEELILAHARVLGDYDSWHGHELPFVGWEEITNWSTDELYLKMFSVCRSSGPKEMPRIIRATTNPSGKGHNWVRKRFIDPAPSGTIITDKESGNQRVAIFGHWSENTHLMDNDPDYLKNLMDNPPHLVKAWIHGSWDIVSGGMFDDVWKSEYNVVPPFTIPGNWRIDHGFDWGSGHPFSVLWFAESDGCDIKWADGYEMSTRPGDLFVIAEWYGADKRDDSKGLKLTAQEIAQGIIAREKAMGLVNVEPGPADSELWNVKGKTTTLAQDMEQEGVYFIKANKAPGSRVAGWDKMRKAIKAAWCDDEDGIGLFVFNTCRHVIAHIPVLPRDEINLEDVDTDSLDHDSDCIRYKINTKRSTLGVNSAPGTY
jgi:hypothetical protein